MAVWQFDLFLVPPSTAIGSFDRDPPSWCRPLPDFESAFQALLPAGDSWHYDLQTWGEEDGTRIDLLRPEPSSREVFVRIDLRAPAGTFIARLLADADAWQARLFLPEAQVVIEPKSELLAGAIRESSAARFVTDPRAFFDEIAAGRAE